MKNKILLFNFEIICLIFTIVFGLISHFLYDFTNSAFIGIFCPINESVWEHLKIVFTPTLITILIGYFYYKKIYQNYIFAKCIGLIYSLLFIIFSFYIYTGILGVHLLILDILIFFISCFIVEIYTLKYCNNDSNKNNRISMLILLFLFILFIIFTFKPIKINLFLDMKSNTYGIKKIEDNSSI